MQFIAINLMLLGMLFLIRIVTLSILKFFRNENNFFCKHDWQIVRKKWLPYHSFRPFEFYYLVYCPKCKKKKYITVDDWDERIREKEEKMKEEEKIKEIEDNYFVEDLRDFEERKN